MRRRTSTTTPVSRLSAVAALFVFFLVFVCGCRCCFVALGLDEVAVRREEGEEEESEEEEEEEREGDGEEGGGGGGGEEEGSW